MGMKTVLTIITVFYLTQVHGQIEGTYVAMNPKKCVVTLNINTDGTCKCLMDFPKYGATESFEGTWKSKGDKINIYMSIRDNKQIKVSSYRLVELGGEVIVKGTKPWGRVRIFRKKKYWLKKVN